MSHTNSELNSILVRTLRAYAVFRMDTEGVITSWNEGVREVLGYGEAEWLGKDAATIFTPEQREEGVLEREMNEAASWQEAVDDRWHVRKDGSLAWINGVMMGLRNEKGELLGFAKVMRDNTELREAQESLRRSHETLEQRVRERTAELEAANQELADFNYSASHSLRSPLRGIDGFSQLLQDEYFDVLGVTGRGYLRRVRESASRLGKHLDDLLALSNVTSGPIERKRIDLSTMVKRRVEVLRHVEGEREVRVQEEVTVGGDQEALGIVLERLLENAWKFTQNQEDAVIEFGGWSGDDEHVFFVRDNGVGFDAAYSDKLFKAFQSLHSPSEFAGSGVGLTIVKRIVERHGGRVWAESEVGKGATFYFSLPLDS